jgi:hypothetical protein
MTAELTWIVLIRDVSRAVQVEGQAKTTASLVLDMDTGEVCGLSVKPTEQESCRAALRTALARPDRPARMLCGPGYGELAGTELAAVWDTARPPEVTEVVSPDAEDIFDSFIGHLSGRAQPDDPGEPADWQLLYDKAAAYTIAKPWLRIALNDPLDLTVQVGGTAARYVAVVIGQEGVQRGLVLYPHGSASNGPQRPPAGTILCYLDPREEALPDYAAKAARYGWPGEAELIPLCLAVQPEGLADLDRTSVYRLILALTGVVSHDRPGPAEPTAGQIVLPNGDQATYSVA